MDEAAYLKKQNEDIARYESLCRQCGACCGAYEGDPCSNLLKLEEGRYYCKNYENRLGPQKSLSGRTFNCVLIRENLARYSLSNPNCGYKSTR